MVYIPQYATTTDPDVIEAIAETLRRDEVFNGLAMAFANEHSGAEKPEFWSSKRSGLIVLVGIGGPRPAQGQWVLIDRKDGIWRPRLHSDLYKQMVEIEYVLPAVPGLARSYRGVTDGDGRTVLLSPRLFVLDGVAWLSFSAPPANLPKGRYGETEFDTSIWTEALGSAWHAARAEFEDSTRLAAPWQDAPSTADQAAQEGTTTS